MDNGKTAADAATDEIVISAVRTLCQFSVRVSQQNHFDMSLKALDNVLK